MSDYIHERVIKNGIPNPLWIRNQKFIEEFIKKNKLQPINFNETSPSFKGIENAQALKMSYPWWWFGGMKFAHLHFNGEVFALSDEQWKSFSDKLRIGFKTKIEDANSISFERALNLSDVIDTMI